MENANRISDMKFLRPDGSKRPQGVERRPRKINFRFAGIKFRPRKINFNFRGILSRPRNDMFLNILTKIFVDFLAYIRKLLYLCIKDAKHGQGRDLRKRKKHNP